MGFKNLLDKAKDIFSGVTPQEVSNRLALQEMLAPKERALNDQDIARAIAFDKDTNAGSLLPDKHPQKVLLAETRSAVQQLEAGNNSAMIALGTSPEPFTGAAFNAVTVEPNEANIRAKMAVAQELKDTSIDNYVSDPGPGSAYNVQRASALSFEAMKMAGQTGDVALAAEAMQHRENLFVNVPSGHPSARSGLDVAMTDIASEATPAKMTLAAAAIQLGASPDRLKVEDKIALLQNSSEKIQLAVVDALGTDKISRGTEQDAAANALIDVAQKTASPALASASLAKLTTADDGGHNIINNSYSHGAADPETVEATIEAVGDTLKNHPQLVTQVFPDAQAVYDFETNVNHFRSNQYSKQNPDASISQAQMEVWEARHGHEGAQAKVKDKLDSLPPRPAAFSIADLVGRDEKGPNPANLLNHFASVLQNGLTAEYNSSANLPRVEQAQVARQIAELHGAVLNDTLAGDDTKQLARAGLTGLIAAEDVKQGVAQSAFDDIRSTIAQTRLSGARQDEIVGNITAGTYERGAVMSKAYLEDQQANDARMALVRPVGPDLPDPFAKHFEQMRDQLDTQVQELHAGNVAARLGAGREQLDKLIMSDEPSAQKIAQDIAGELKQKTAVDMVPKCAPAPAMDSVAPRLLTARL